MNKRFLFLDEKLTKEDINNGIKCAITDEYNLVKEVKIINLTPHNINIINGDKVKEIRTGGNARVGSKSEKIGELDGINITSIVFDKVEGLPEEKEDTYYIVSRMIKEACKERKDLLVPNELVRDTEGRIIGCESLSIN